MPKVLSIRDLRISFKTNHGFINAIRGVKLDLYKGETLAIVGESGSGKSVTAQAISNKLDENALIESGHIQFTYVEGGIKQTKNLLALTPQELKAVNEKRIINLFNETKWAVKDEQTISQLVASALDKNGIDEKQLKEEVMSLLAIVGFKDVKKRAKQYPEQLSSKSRQRLAMAIALAKSPDIIICDETVADLEMEIQDKNLNVLKEVQKRTNVSIIFITHNIELVRNLADYVAVMSKGRVVEKGAVTEVLSNPKHPCTCQLLAQEKDKPEQLKTSCSKHHPCQDKEKHHELPMINVGGKHRVASWFFNYH